MRKGEVFSEVQPFYIQPVAWIAWIVFLLLIWILMRGDFIFDWLYYLILVIIVLVVLMVLFGRLETRIDSNAVQVRMVPFHRIPKTLLWSDITNVEIVEYRPIRDYGGWGIRLGSKGTAYTVKGKYGLQITLEDGRVVLIGTQRPGELGEILNIE